MRFLFNKTIYSSNYKFLYQKINSTKFNQTVAVNKKCSFHTNSRLNAITPFIWAIFAKPAIKLGAILSGRYCYCFISLKIIMNI